MASGPSMSNTVNELVEKIMLFIIPNAATDAASSTPDIAIIIVGIPLATPYPFDLKRKRQGTITAGETAAITEPEKCVYINKYNS